MLRRMEIFLTVCRNMNMTKAAEELHISQSAISQAIKDLEYNYKAKLFERINNRIALTHAGSTLRDYSQHLLDYYKEIEYVMRMENESPELRLGGSVSIGNYYLNKLVADYKKVDPDLNIFLYSSLTSEIEELLLNGELDVAVVGDRVDNESLIIEPLTTDSPFIICKKGDNPFGDNAQPGNSIELEALAGTKLVLRKHVKSYPSLLADTLSAKNIPYRVAGIYNSYDGVKVAVENGLGIGVISKYALIPPDYSVFDIYTVPEDLLIRNLSLIYNRQKFFNEKTQNFLEYLRLVTK